MSTAFQVAIRSRGLFVAPVFQVVVRCDAQPPRPHQIDKDTQILTILPTFLSTSPAGLSSEMERLVTARWSDAFSDFGYKKRGA